MSPICHLQAIKTSHRLRTLQAMQEHGTQPPREPGEAGPGPIISLAPNRLRDAGWLPAFQGSDGQAEMTRTQLLHHWKLGVEQRAAGLLFQALDGNPRHGVLALFVDEGELHGAIEIVERQGRWLVMPDDLRARSLAVAAMARPGAQAALRSSIAGTPDRRFIFFNSLREGGTATLVERRREGGTTPT